MFDLQCFDISCFGQDTNKVLAISRILVAWQPVGLAVGVYDMVLRYTKERKQFNTPIAAFQVHLSCVELTVCLTVWLVLPTSAAALLREKVVRQ